MMTKSDFQAIADVFNDAMENMNQPITNDMFLSGKTAGIEELAEGMADMLARQNFRFDRKLFLDACGLGV